MASRQRSRRPALFALGHARPERVEIELCDARAKRRDLAAELLCPFRRSRLQRERPEALLHLGLDVARTLDLERDALQLQLGPVPLALEAAEPCGLLDHLAPLLRRRREHLLDLSLPDDRVHRAAEPEVGEQLDEVDPAHRRPVDEVLPLPAPVQPPGDRELGVVDRPVAVGVVEEELDLAEVDRLAAGRTGEEHVVGLLGAELRRRERTRGPDDPVGDVRLPGAVRSDHDGHAGLEPDFHRVGERLEAAQLDRAQVHACGRLAGGADAATAISPRGSRGGRVPRARPLALHPSSSAPSPTRPARRRRAPRR